jgi:glycosyltransferase involved in cell wall biosynthesis
MEQKHIVIDARIRPASTGRYVDRLLEHLQTIDTTNRYTVLLDPSDSWQPTAKNFAALPCPYKKFSFNPLDHITFARFIHKLKPDLVHFAMTPQEPLFYFGKRITTTHDLTMLRFTRAGRMPLPLHWLRMAGYRFTFWYSHRIAKAIIVGTEYVKQDLGKLHPFTKSKIFVTLEASEPPLPIKSEPLDGVKKPFIMHVGSPFPHKNIERLIEAFGLLKKDGNPSLQLVLAGKKEYYFEQLEKRLATNEFKQDIIIPGFISDAALKWLYENTETYVLPSLSEGFGLPGLEAMVHGVPVASSNATCLPEVYGDAAAFFNPTDQRHMAVVIDDIISNPSFANKLRTRGKRRVTCFSWEKMAKETFSVYQSVLYSQSP